ncbi:MAG TPA: TIGR02587 family membrane protein [Chthoniobacterales bacterium]
MNPSSSSPPVVQSLREYARGIAGGLMFSLPLLYTMEVWWTGFVVGPARLLLYGGFTFVLLLGYNHYAGMHEDSCWSEVLIDSVEELGLGLLVSAGLLFLLGRVSLEASLDDTIGKIVVEAMTVAIGISVGTGQLGVKTEDAGAGKRRSLREEIRFGGQLVIAGCGAMLFAANIAPTQEVVVIATNSSIAQLLGLMLLSLLITALILYYIEFAGSDRFVRRGDLTAVVVGTFASYAVSLATAAAVLWLFGRFENAALITAVAETIDLGLATTLGASAGRLLVQ